MAQTVEAGRSFLTQAYETLKPQLASIDAAIALAVIIVSLLLSRLAAKFTRTFLDRLMVLRKDSAVLNRLHMTLSSLIVPAVWVLLIGIATEIFQQLGMASGLLRVAYSLLIPWIVIRLMVSVLADGFLRRLVAVVAWTVAALNILQLLDPTIAFLDGLAFSVAGTRISAFLLLKGGVIAAVLLWVAGVTASAVETRLVRTGVLTQSAGGLVGQMLRLVLVLVALMLALSTIGIDLTALAVFTGALGVGLGFGMQSIFANIMAGLTLLLERSLRVGDFVELGEGTAGEVREMKLRSTLITTNDNIDILIPNAEFIADRVTNWTMREAQRRLRIPFGVAYGTDKNLVKKAGLEAAQAVDFTLTGVTGREPDVWLTEFGDNSLNFELVVWLKDEATKRPSTVNAAYCWALEDALAKYNINIPFPQRDIHLIQPADINVHMKREPSS